MTESDLSLLLALLLAHLIGDFVLQSDHWARQKRLERFLAPALYYHVGVHLLLTLATLLVFSAPLLSAVVGAIVVALSHALIGGLKSYIASHSIGYFLLDQLLHLMILVGVWFALTQPAPLSEMLDLKTLWGSRALLIALAYGLALRPASILIALIMRRWSQGVDTSGTLADAGARIGMLERFLILTFVLSDQMTAIGFLLTAKSVLRFGDLYEDRDRKLTEYVLLGTMLSFSITLTLGLATRQLLSAL